MKKLTQKTWLILAVLVLLSCTSRKVADTTMLELKADFYYLAGSDQPYSGRAISTDENGQVMAVLNFLNGSYADQVRYWDENGALILEVNMADGLLNGRFTYQEEDYRYDARYDKGELLNREIRYAQDGIKVIQRYADSTLTTSELNQDGEVIGSYEQAYTELTRASVATEKGMLVISFAEPDQLIGRLLFLDGKVLYQENYVDGELSILLYHERSAGNNILHCYYDNGELLALSDAICTELPLR